MASFVSTTSLCNSLGDGGEERKADIVYCIYSHISSDVYVYIYYRLFKEFFIKESEMGTGALYTSWSVGI